MGSAVAMMLMIEKRMIMIKKNKKNKINRK